MNTYAYIYTIYYIYHTLKVTVSLNAVDPPHATVPGDSEPLSTSRCLSHRAAGPSTGLAAEPGPVRLSVSRVGPISGKALTTVCGIIAGVSRGPAVPRLASCERWYRARVLSLHWRLVSISMMSLGSRSDSFRVVFRFASL